jgi:hypothetical protein
MIIQAAYAGKYCRYRQYFASGARSIRRLVRRCGVLDPFKRR